MGRYEKECLWFKKVHTIYVWLPFCIRKYELLSQKPLTIDLLLCCCVSVSRIFFFFFRKQNVISFRRLIIKSDFCIFCECECANLQGLCSETKKRINYGYT